MSEVNNLLWCEKYRPSTIDDCVLPAATKAMVKEFVAKGEIPNILAHGGAGSGKCHDKDEPIAIYSSMKVGERFRGRSHDDFLDVEGLATVMKIYDLFKAYGAENSPNGEAFYLPDQIFVESAGGTLVPVIALVRKTDNRIVEVTLDNGVKFKCSDQHLLVNDGDAVKVCDATIIDWVSPSGSVEPRRVASVKFDRVDDVFDIAIPAPHLYVTPNGVVHHNTTLSKAIANEMGADLLYINASLENSVDTIRTRVIQFASTVSLSGSAKIILLDEADFLTVNAQASLRGVIEEFSNVRFFLTCNYKNRIIEALHSRTTAIDFKIDRAEMPSVMKSFFMRVKMILDSEGVKYDQKVVATVIQKYFPDFRRTINALQGCASSGAIDIATLVSTDDGVYAELFSAMKQKKFSDVRKWVGQHSDIESQQIFKDLYERSADLFELQCIPQIVLVLGDWSYKATTSMDQELCTICALTEIMAIASWK